MQMFFYCTPEDLQEIFSEIELTYSLVYEPRFGSVPRIIEIDGPLRKPFYSCRDYSEFGKAFYDTPPFHIYVSEDETRHISTPNLLHFSGPPAFVSDSYILCEGSLFLEPENKEETPRTLYKNIKKIFSKRFIKSGHCYISPYVYDNRKEYLFIQRDHGFLAPAWCFDKMDQHTPINIDSWYQMKGKLREKYEKPQGKFSFFSARKDLKAILGQLENGYDLKYVEVIRHGKDKQQEVVFDTVDAFMSDGLCGGSKRNLYVYDQTCRMLLLLGLDVSWDINGRFAVISEALEVQNAFGNKLYYDFVDKVKEQFQKISEQHYGPFYISPLLYEQRHNIALSLNDPYFRIDKGDNATHIWRKDWPAWGQIMMGGN